MSDLPVCPICDEGHLHARSEMIEVEHAGHTGQIESLYSECDECGSETATAAQVRDNKRAMIAFKKQADGLMTGADVKAMRQALGLNQDQAARMFGGGPVAFSKYENDDVVQSEPMNNLLKVAHRFPIVAAFLAREAGMILPDRDHLLEGGQSASFARPYVPAELGRSMPDRQDGVIRTAVLSSATIELTFEEYSHAI